MASPWPSGAANSTNSKPLIPIGFSKVVTVIPRFGCALMGGLRACVGRPHVIVSYETICKPPRSMSDALQLEHFLPYRLSVLSNRISDAIAREYSQRYALGVTEWRVMAVLGRWPGLTASQVAQRTAMDKVAV